MSRISSQKHIIPALKILILAAKIVAVEFLLLNFRIDLTFKY